MVECKNTQFFWYLELLGIFLWYSIFINIDCISPHLVCMWMGTPNLRHQLTLWSQKEMVYVHSAIRCVIRLRRVWQYLQAWPEIYYIFIPDTLSDNFLYKVLHLNSLVCKNLLISFYPSIKLNRNKVSGFWYISKPADSLFGKWKDYYAGLCLLGFMSGTKKKRSKLGFWELFTNLNLELSVYGGYEIFSVNSVG